MKCNNCGSYNHANIVACNNCGHRLVLSYANDDYTPPPIKDNSSSQYQSFEEFSASIQSLLQDNPVDSAINAQSKQRLSDDSILPNDNDTTVVQNKNTQPLQQSSRSEKTSNSTKSQSYEPRVDLNSKQSRLGRFEQNNLDRQRRHQQQIFDEEYAYASEVRLNQRNSQYAQNSHVKSGQPRQSRNGYAYDNIEDIVPSKSIALVGLVSGVVGWLVLLLTFVAEFNLKQAGIVVFVIGVFGCLCCFVSYGLRQNIVITTVALVIIGQLLLYASIVIWVR
ncbi:MAG: hypothetical protein FWF56_05330 [Firmicutes bacterium]|nr:hypothetical protein [Bacillota bacterium]MCL1953792.1 hypothetical protein [Bacillota bacterium]